MSSSMLFRRTTAASAGAARSFSTTSPRSIAKMSIIGNLADTPELHQTSNGRELVRYAVASNTGPRDNRQTSWFRITSFNEGPRRDFLLSLPKGCLVYIEGDAAIKQYEDAEGNSRSALNIVQRSIEVLKRPHGAAEPAESSESSH
ncbi:Single-stranded DNA-binding protein-like protein [Hapsidospora chrysogenum ATCC 11550]|uniref:Single-stranded DNA-binding protein n=1 Tax=Hapsidospora chrysogenum (strain ATCC 11550 / CBS 779.69 / DSM 880 / IAM 14645 / JCM 23072 / IMI 49137) TaxID=857340 RepID=A0A086THP7_HAPC1|nr:Single-stranded DNA-binding protein-like protein [Hapsidospora chrysogenum ATCC 11550]